MFVSSKGSVQKPSCRNACAQRQMTFNVQRLPRQEFAALSCPASICYLPSVWWQFLVSADIAC